MPEALQLDFFELAMARHAEAMSRAGETSIDLDVAGTRVRLLFAGRSLVPYLAPALSHLAVEADGAPDVSFHLWDSASTSVEMPPPPCTRECFTDRGDIWGMMSERIRSAFNWSEFAVSLLDLETRRGLFWVRSTEFLPYWTRSSPLRTLFHWWVASRDAHLLHAAAVGDENGALLITGKGGVGKSTTALACLAAGMRYVADDYLIVRLEPQPRVFSLYRTAKLNPETLERFGQLDASRWTVPGVSDEKVVLTLSDAQLARSLPLRAIVTPRLYPTDETTFVGTSALALHRAAAFTTMSQLPHAGRGTYEFIERLIAAKPGLEMRLGHDLSRIPNAVRSLLALPDRDVECLAQHDPLPAATAKRPLVSVIVPVFNGAHWLDSAVASILEQQYPAIEIIVVDDGSSDDIANAVRRLPIEVRFLRQENAGPAAARNRGIKDASGDLIAFLDVDDLWPERNLDLLVDRMSAAPHADVVHGVAQTVAVASDTGSEVYVGNPVESFPYYIGAGLYRRRAFERVGLFDPALRFGEDGDWFARARERGVTVEHLDAITLFVRRHDGNSTRGKSMVDLNALRVLKLQLDRHRTAKLGDGEPASASSPV